jgi:hypothetical protein
MARRFKSSRTASSEPVTIGPAAEARIAQGEHWLTVWYQQTATPLPVLAKRSGLPMSRLIEIEQGQPVTNDEMDAIAKGLRTATASIGLTIAPKM